MKELLLQLSAYNAWANAQLLQALRALPEDTLRAELRSSFPSLYATVLHMLDAESIWWQRLKLQENIQRPSDSFRGEFSELVRLIEAQDREWQEWIAAARETMLEHEFKYHNTKREPFKQPVFQMLLHLFNHNTYHRGQLVTLMRQLGLEKIPATDFIVWSRKR